MKLTPRQFEVLHLLAGGKCPKEIAVVLGLKTRRTVDYHTRGAIKNLNCSTLAHAVARLTRIELQEEIHVVNRIADHCLFR